MILTSGMSLLYCSNYKLLHLIYIYQVPWKSLGKEPVIVLIDRVFVLASPASDYHILRVHTFILLLFGLERNQLLVSGCHVFCLIWSLLSDVGRRKRKTF